ncbi:MAG: hypothetical protein ACXACW_14735 [Candidatus Hodarchaeales archaeon]|jgi:hypothetical protein
MILEQYYNKESGRVFLLGNGPSLAEYDISKLNPNEVIAINRSWRECPTALYYCTSGDLQKQIGNPKNVLFLGQPEQIKNIKCPAPVILIQTRILGVRIPEPKTSLGIPPQFDLRWGWPPTHVGLFALYAAWFLGFREIWLLGYDGYGLHYSNVDPNVPDHDKLIPEFVKYGNRLTEYDSTLKVYNCNHRNKYCNFPVDRPSDLC